MPKDIENDLLNSILRDDDDAGGNDRDDNIDSGHGSDDLDRDLGNDDDDDDLDLGDDNGQNDDDKRTDKRKPEQRKPTTPVDKNKKPEDDKNKNKDDKAFDEFDPAVRLQEDGKGNLIAPGGRIVARAGRERQLFERWRTKAQQSDSSLRRMAINTRRLAEGSRDLLTKYNTLEKQKGMFEQAGLSFDEQKQMLDIAVEYKKNPQQGIKRFLTMAHMAGIDISKLGVAGGLDTSTVVESLKNHLTEQFEKTSKREDPNTAQKEAEDFLASNEEAWKLAEEIGFEKFGSLMDKAKSQFPDMSYEQLFHALERQYLRSKLAAKEQQPERRPNPKNRQTPPNNQGGSRRQFNSRKQLTGSESFDDIGADVLKDIQKSL